MKSAVRDRARNLAIRPYSVTVSKDHAGAEEVFLVEHPELPGCMAQGRTLEEALKELDDARFEYIASLLEDGQRVPPPSVMLTSTSGGSSTVDVVVQVTSPRQSSSIESLRSVMGGTDRDRLYVAVEAAG
ncbi:MAG: type II toxin-antitoxin system HicB family antitoxin [Chloroflexi bacterium]|nr:type II toxin-antitoxin system HicB family antitoxin [Chloroflexota bacterium]